MTGTNSDLTDTMSDTGKIFISGSEMGDTPQMEDTTQTSSRQRTPNKTRH